MDLNKMTIKKAAELLNSGEVSSRELTIGCLDRIKKVDGDVKAFLTVDEENALKMADKADKLRQSGEEISPVNGIPMALKDNMCVKDMKCTCASKILENFIPPYDSSVAEKIKSSGGVILGKLNMDEFAMGSSNENSAYHKTRNPWDLDRVPGGSSGGAAASVAAGEVLFSLGSDTGGSIRQPASFCGVVGLKPTYGLVSRYGLVAFASSLDQIGPMAKSVEGCAAALNIIAGHDDRDTTSANIKKADYTVGLTGDIKGMKIGVPRDFLGDGMDKDVSAAINNAIKQYVKLGAEIVDITLPSSEFALSAYYIVSSAEASSNLARYDGIKYGYRTEQYDNLIDLYKKTRSEGFGKEVKRRIMLGTYVLSSGYYDAYYLKALKARTLIVNDFAKAFKSCDVILTPTSPSTAFKLGEKTDDPMTMYLSDIYTVPINMAGLPALSVNCGFDNCGLPIGMQLISNAFDESSILKAGHAFEINTDFNKMADLGGR